jgi:hypothetical protein
MRLESYPDLKSASQVHLQLALKYLDEGRGLIGKDPTQASEKLYKAAEEAVKALTAYFNLSNILSSVEKRGRWTVTELEKAVEAISEKLGAWFRGSWDTAWTLHVWGFHEAKFDSKAVEIRLPDIERIVIETQKNMKKRGSYPIFTSSLLYGVS